jgi:hypothetical protein
MSAAAFTVEDLYCNVTEGPSIGALNIRQGNYSHLPAEKGNLISSELKLGTSGEKNIRDAQKRIKTLCTWPLCKAGSVNGQNQEESQRKNLKRFHNNALR